MKWNKALSRFSLPLTALWSAVLYFVIEWMSRHSFPAAWNYMTDKPSVFAYNAGMLFMTFLVVYLVRHRLFLGILISVLWTILGVINSVILANRVTPFTGPDLKNLSDGKAVMGKYLSSFEMTLIYVLLAMVGVALVVMFFKCPSYRGKFHRLVNLALVVACFFTFSWITDRMLQKRILSNYFGNIAFAYEDYGYPYCLLTTLLNTGISEPQGYSEKEIRRIVRSERNLPETGEARPNIIFVQLESFMDTSLVNYLETSQDPLPVFHSLMKKYSSGYFKVPSVGAGTANTEFETITGMSLHYFGPGEYPYKSILQSSTCESVPYVLAGLDYTSHALHNNEANFYSRKTVFSRLGFNTFTSAEFMEHEDEKNPMGWTKDKILTEEIVKCLDSTEGQDYIYCISVQGHGDYPPEPVLEDPVITVKGSPTPEMDQRWEYYCNQIYEMDQFVGELVDTLSSYPEDVVLVMYGDHLPTMGLTVEDMKNRYLFQTSYVLWDNFGLKKQDANLAAYQMGAEVLDRVGIHEGNILRYHQARRNTRNYQVDMEMLQYDMLYGSQYIYGEGGNPFERTQMRLGLYDVTLDSMELVSSWNNSYYLHGTNFTPSTQVKLNGSWYETIYISPTTLLISGTEIGDFDRLCVCQRSNSSTRKSLSKSRDRLAYALFAKSRWKFEEEGKVGFGS